MERLSFVERFRLLAIEQQKIVEEMELQPESWKDIPRDTLICVRDGRDSKWKRAYFNRYDEMANKVWVYSNGQTSLTIKRLTEESWFSYYKLLSEDEVNEPIAK